MIGFFNDFILQPFFGIDDFSDLFEEIFFDGRMRGKFNNLLRDMESEFSHMNNIN